MDTAVERAPTVLGGERKNITAITLRSQIDLPEFEEFVQEGMPPAIAGARRSFNP